MLQEEEYDSDTSDEDFVPEGAGVESEDEPLSAVEDEEQDDVSDDEDSKARSKKKKKKGRKGQNNQQDKDDRDKELDPEEKKAADEDDNKKADSIWADFLADVEDEQPEPKKTAKTSSWSSLLGNKKTTSSSSTVPSKQQLTSSKSDGEKSEEAENKSSTVKITQVFEFAGEEVRVEKEVDADSEEAKAALSSPAQPSSATATEKASTTPGEGGGKKRPGGLSSIVGFLDNKKQKLTTLEKTKLDWNSFKSEHGLDEELESHKKSKHGYLDKQAFLERADLRQFEIEKTMRMNKRSNR